MLYDRPVRELMREAANQLSLPTSPNEIISWFAREYPLVKRTTVAAHIKGLTVNDRNRHHYSVSRYEPIFRWTSDGFLDLYDPDTHLEDEGSGTDEDEVGGDDGGEGTLPVTRAVAEFVLEAHLEEFLLGNWDMVDWGRPLRIWEDANGARGHQVSTLVGRLDLLCVDTSTNALVVVELKRGHSADRASDRLPGTWAGCERTSLQMAKASKESLWLTSTTIGCATPPQQCRVSRF